MLAGWCTTLRRLAVRSVLRVYDDGSDEQTARRLDSLSHEIDDLLVVHQKNIGHGPTLVRAYRDSLGSWILQIDGDDVIGPAAFASLWNRRHEYDLLMGIRHGRHASAVRRSVTWCARKSVHLAFGANLQDVNTPYRLMRRSAFAPLFNVLPADTFAPNVALTGMAVQAGLRVLQAPVQCFPDRRRPSSLGSLRLVRAVIKSAYQTLVLGIRMRYGSTSTNVR